MSIPAVILQKDLINYGVDTDGWSEAMLTRLADEINQGESRLEITNLGITRVVRAVKLFIRACIPSRRDFDFLVEKRRFYPDGRRLEKTRCPTGKIRAGESCVSALKRELAEEFGVTAGNYRFKFIRTETMEPVESFSYSGLTTAYVFEQFFVWLSLFAAERIKEGYAVDDNGIQVVFGWETIAEFHARVEREKALTQNA